MFDQPPVGIKPENQSPAQPSVPTPPAVPAQRQPIPAAEPIDMLSNVEPVPPTELSKRPLMPPALPTSLPLAPPAPIGPIAIPHDLPIAKEGLPWSKIIIAIGVVIILGGGGFAAYTYRSILFGLNQPLTPVPPENTNNVLTPEQPDQPVTPPPPLVLDADGDGLTDEQEASLGTDAQNPDTDGDGLFDGEEINAYHINLLNLDSDSDGYRDGDEVKSGYNPNGPGKLLNVPAELQPNQ